MARGWLASTVAIFTLVLVSFLRPLVAAGANGDCSQPITSGAVPAATDCLRILQVAVGAATCEPHDPCVCAPKGSLPTSATDALTCLVVAVGGSTPLACPCEAPPTTTTTNTNTSTTSTVTTTTTIPPECIVDADCWDIDPCNGFETCAGGECVAGSSLGCDPNGGDIVIVVPYDASPVATAGVAAMATDQSPLDVYLLVDQSGGMNAERDALASGIAGALGSGEMSVKYYRAYQGSDEPERLRAGLRRHPVCP